MRTIFEFIVGAAIVVGFALLFALALLGEDAPHQETQTNKHRAWVAQYATHTQDEAAIKYLRGE